MSYRSASTAKERFEKMSSISRLIKRISRISGESQMHTANTYEEYLAVMRKHHKQSFISQEPESKITSDIPLLSSIYDREDNNRTATIISMVPDEVINIDIRSGSVRTYEAALMFCDVSGFTDLCEKYTSGYGGPSKLTEVLNSYIGSMIQEILTHNGDVLKFSGDAFLSMWKKTPKLSMQEVVHNAIDCALIIQRNYGTFKTDVGVILKVKVAISAGLSHFSIIGDDEFSSFVIVGEPVWDVKMAQYMCTAGDVIAAASAWTYVNEAEYCTQSWGDGTHTKVLGIGESWKKVEKLHDCTSMRVRSEIITSVKDTSWQGYRKFVAKPVLLAVDNGEPLEFLTEVRRVVVVFINIVVNTVCPETIIEIVDKSYKSVASAAAETDGIVNKVSLFDKDMMFLVVFGLRGLKHENEAQNAIRCAAKLKKKIITDENIMSVSVGITSGTTYCGVVGHVLRREYTVIGPTVNKAARLMVNYPDVISCDKETFLRSKLQQEYFRPLQEKRLKGIQHPGPLYEFNEDGWLDRGFALRLPILGRNEEIRTFKTLLQKAMEQYHRSFTRYVDHVYAIAFIGPKSIGKTRLLEECIQASPDFLQTADHIKMKRRDKMPYNLFRQIINKHLTRKTGRSVREFMEHAIRFHLDITKPTPLQIYSLNIILDCRFPLPESFSYTGDLLSEISVKNIIKELSNKIFKSLWILGIDEAQYIDDQSWRLLLVILETKKIFIVFCINEEIQTSDVVKACLKSNMILTMELKGINRLYHAALTCQLLDVQAIPPDLEKVIETASNGIPGWIQNFVISLVQRGILLVVTVPRSEALKLGAVMPSPMLLQKRTEGISAENLIKLTSHPEDKYSIIQMAVLANNYTFMDTDIDFTTDVIILKVYDSLTPFEKIILKCGSVLGNVFSRRMLCHMLQSDCQVSVSERQIAEAIEKLFEIRVLECEGGDFTRNISLVLVHPAPAPLNAVLPYCSCLGTIKSVGCSDLHGYAFCGYMKFCHSVFRSVMYNLLLENQKKEMHARALLYFEQHTRKCVSCGSGCFTKFLGVYADDGLQKESEDVKQTRRQIHVMNMDSEARLSRLSVHYEYTDGAEKMSIYRDNNTNNLLAMKRVRSFSSFQLEACECVSILLSVFNDVLEHCRLAGEREKLFEGYKEYTEICILIHVNIPEALRLVGEMEELLNETNCKESASIYRDWRSNFKIGVVASLRGACYIVSRDLDDARTYLLKAMRLFFAPFPTKKGWIKIYNCAATIRQHLALYLVPQLYIGSEGVYDDYYEVVCTTLFRLVKLFEICKEQESAELAAKYSLQCALRTNSNFLLLCYSYGNMIAIYRQKRQFAKCRKLELLAYDICRRKRGQLDIREVPAVCLLYTNIFLYCVDAGKRFENLEFALSVLYMLPNATASSMSTRQNLVLCMLKLFLLDLKIYDMVAIMREFLYLTDYYDVYSETWYYCYSLIILLDTGYCVETYAECESFYIRKGDSMLRSKTPEIPWNFYVCMWLITVRLGAWERSTIWREQINKLFTMKFDNHEFNLMIVIRLIEGILITLVMEMDNRNQKKVVALEDALKILFEHYLDKYCKNYPIYLSRYYLLYAYYSYIQSKTFQAFKYLKKAEEQSKQSANFPMVIWIRHTKKHWNKTLDPLLVNYWVDHLEPRNLLDYREYDPDKVNIVPYTLPLPKHYGI